MLILLVHVMCVILMLNDYMWLNIHVCFQARFGPLLPGASCVWPARLLALDVGELCSSRLYRAGHGRAMLVSALLRRAWRALSSSLLYRAVCDVC